MVCVGFMDAGLGFGFMGELLVLLFFTATDPVSQLSTYSMSTSSVVNHVNLTNWMFLHS